MPTAFPTEMSAEQLLRAALYALRSAARGEPEKLLLTIVGLRSIVGLAHTAESYALPADGLVELLNAVNDVSPVIEGALTDEMPFYRSSFAFFAASIVIEAFSRAGDDDEDFWSQYVEAVEHVSLMACELEMIYRRQNLGKGRTLLQAQWRFVSEVTPFNAIPH